MAMLSKQQWIKKYGGAHLLDGFEVVPCLDCDDPICHGWRVQNKNPVRIAGELVERAGLQIDDKTFAEAAAVLEAEVDRVAPLIEHCFICHKPKGQPPDRCPGHYIELGETELPKA